MMAAAIAIGIVSNLLSGVSPSFGMLVAMRLVSGVSLGLIAWISWTEVFGDDERVGDVAVIGPIVGTVASPVIATFLDAAGPDWLYFASGRGPRAACPRRPFHAARGRQA